MQLTIMHMIRVPETVRETGLFKLEMIIMSTHQRGVHVLQDPIFIAVIFRYCSLSNKTSLRVSLLYIRYLFSQLLSFDILLSKL